MTNIHFQIKREDSAYHPINFQEVKTPSPNTVLIDNRNYQLLGASDQIQWLRSKLPELSPHKSISLDYLESRLKAIGAHDISVIGQVNQIGISILSPKEVKAPKTELEAKIDAYLQDMLHTRNFRGAVLIQENGKPLFSGAYGPANETGSHNTKETRFCIGSMTKQFTGASIALLMQNKSLITNPAIRQRLKLDEEGKTLTLDNPIKDLLPSKYWTDKWEGITLDHLLRHTSGIPCYGSPAEDELRSENFHLDELVEIVKNEDLLFNPGEMNFYSNGGYVLLGAIIENLTGKTLETFMHDEIFVPCKMTQTGMVDSYDEETMARGFIEIEKNKMQEIPTIMHLSKTYAAGAIISTVEDMGKWDIALYGTSLFSEKTKKMMFSCSNPAKIYNPDPKKPDLYTTDAKGRHHPRPGTEYKKAHYGFGIGISYTDIPGYNTRGDVLEHGGSFPGFSSHMARYPSSKHAIIILENNGNFLQAIEVKEELERILFA